MFKNIGFMEAVFVLILAYLILNNAKGFSESVKALSTGFKGSVTALQGRGGK